MTRVFKNRLFIVLLTTVVIVSILAVFWIINRDTTVGTSIVLVEWVTGYADFAEFTADADLVVVGSIDRVVAETSEKGIPGTEFLFKVDSVLKGEQVTQIVIRQMGAAGEMEAYDDPLFSPGEHYILFLREYETGKYVVLGGPEGRFMIVGDQVYSMDNILPDRVYVDALKVDGISKEAFIDLIREIVTSNSNGSNVTSASWAYEYGSFEELTGAADLIVVGSIDSVIAETTEDLSHGAGESWLYSTDFSFNVDEVLKGEQVTQIVIHQLGAAGKMAIRDDPLFRTGERYILFLEEYEPGKCSVLGGPQGRFKIVWDQVCSMNHVFPWSINLTTLDVVDLSTEAFIDSISEIVADS